MTKLEIIDETVKFYSEDTTRRSIIFEEGIIKSKCLYNGSNNKKCAFSRCCKPELIKELYEGISCASQNNGNFDYYLQDKYKGHYNIFWVYIQSFHDNDIHWDKNGLTSLGLLQLEVLKEKFK